MNTLSKLALNNTIVLMRKSVRQARIQCINKLTREIKRLKQKNGTEEQKAKNLRKAGRYGEEILIMKKIQDDEVSRFALLNERNMIEITNDVTETLEKKSLARLAYNKSVEEKVKTFREKNAKWKETIFVLMSSLGERNAFKKNKQSSSKKTKYKHVESRVKCSSQVNSKTEIVTMSGTWIVESIQNRLPKPKNSLETLKSLNVQSHQKMETGQVTFCDNVSRKEEIISTGANKQNTILFENEKIMQTKILQLEECNSEPVKNIEIVGAVDPFFLTKNNTEYISICAVENSEDNFKHQNSSQDSNLNYENQAKKINFKLNAVKRGNILPEVGKNSSLSGSFNKVEESVQKSLHPSWEAKKKLSQVVKFQGTKIKFDGS